MATAKPNVDPEKVKKTAEHVFSMLGGAFVSAMIYLGDRMGLYQALNGAGPMTSEELARKTGLHERWIREWLMGQAAADLISYQGEGRFELTPRVESAHADELYAVRLQQSGAGVGLFRPVPGPPFPTQAFLH